MREMRHAGANFICSVVLLGLLLAISGCQGLGGEPRIVATIPPQESLTGFDQEIAATMMLGGDTWTANCADCHGRLGEGTADGAPLPDLTALTEGQILASVTNGVTEKNMPAFSDKLTAEELLAVATYASMISLARQRNMIDAAATATRHHRRSASCCQSVHNLRSVRHSDTARDRSG
jgi:cytochrome c553